MRRLTCALILAMAPAAAAQETYTATAEVKNAAGEKKTAPVTVSIERYSTPDDRDALMADLKGGGHARAKKALMGMKDIGSVEAGEKKKTVPIKYAFARKTGDGKLVTVVAAEPIAYLGGDLPGAKPKEGYDLSLVLLMLDGSGKGTGEATPAAKIKLREDGAITTEDYGTDIVWLTGVTKK